MIFSTKIGDMVVVVQWKQFRRFKHFVAPFIIVVGVVVAVPIIVVGGMFCIERLVVRPVIASKNGFPKTGSNVTFVCVIFVVNEPCTSEWYCTSLAFDAISNFDPAISILLLCNF